MAQLPYLLCQQSRRCGWNFDFYRPVKIRAVICRHFWKWEKQSFRVKLSGTQFFVRFNSPARSADSQSNAAMPLRNIAQMFPARLLPRFFGVSDVKTFARNVGVFGFLGVKRRGVSLW